MTGSIQYASIGTFQIGLGSGADTVTVKGTAAGTTTAVTLGAAASTVTLQGSDNTTNAVAGVLQLTGDGNDVLQVIDSDAAGAPGTLTQRRITGLGMGVPADGTLY